MLSAGARRPTGRTNRLLSRLRRNQHGFTLIETLVAMVTGVIVTGALFTILDFSVKQSSRLSQVAQASQVSRTAMTHIVDELHSACLSTGFTPVEAGSTPSKLVFITGYSEAAEIPFESVRKEEVEYVLVGGKGYLKEKVATAASEPNFREYTFGSPSTITIAENISPYEESGSNPIFKYYEYGSTTSTGATEAAVTLNQVPLTASAELNAEQAARIASVAISFRTAPYKKEAKLTSAAAAGTFADLTTQTTFAFSAPNSESTIQDKPCE
jgi:prepilin-type N-terminal cleavage/methylation domain-containing protein